LAILSLRLLVLNYSKVIKQQKTHKSPLKQASSAQDPLQGHSISLDQQEIQYLPPISIKALQILLKTSEKPTLHLQTYFWHSRIQDRKKVMASRFFQAYMGKQVKLHKIPLWLVGRKDLISIKAQVAIKGKRLAYSP
jgi:hypothetical protein